MSRTVRRKKGPPGVGWGGGCKPHQERDTVHERYFAADEIWQKRNYDYWYSSKKAYETVVGKWYYSWRPVMATLTPKETKKKVAVYHSDHGFGHYTGRCRRGSNEPGLRMHCKNELSRYANTGGEYEVCISSKRYLRDWWD